jgi:hypothetical protein
MSLSLGSDTALLANVYSDAAHTAINLLHDHMLELPHLRFMCRDFNVHCDWWDPLGPAINVYADCLLEVTSHLSLSLSSPEVEGPTHFPYAEDLQPTVIDLMFILEMESLILHDRRFLRPDGGSKLDLTRKHCS